MGLYIKGMEMPKDREIYLRIDEKGEVYVCGSYPTELYKAVSVPPHGRLIDADKLAEDLDFDVELDQRALDDLDIVGKEREHIQFDKDCKQNCMWYLTESPTIIEAEEDE